MALVVILVVAFAIAKTITNYRIDREYAKQGLESPRMRMKAAKAERGQATRDAVARTRPGASGYFRELWNDAWDDATDRHRARRQARKAGTAPPKQHVKPWWRYLFDPIGEQAPAVPESRRPNTTPAPPVQPSAPPPARPQPSTPASQSPRAPQPPSTVRPPKPGPVDGGHPCPRGCGGWIDMRNFDPPNQPRDHCTNCGWLPPSTTPPQRPGEADPSDQPVQHQATQEGTPLYPGPGFKPPGETAWDMAAREHAQDRNRAANQGGTMSNATGDVHDVESCDRELDALTDDLTAIDTALDVIDEKVGEARSSAELIQAFLAGKKVDGAVLAGLATALEMLGPDAIKTLIDAIAAAKQGVAATKDGMAPLREANQLVGSADGSVLNGR